MNPENVAQVEHLIGDPLKFISDITKAISTTNFLTYDKM